MGLLSAVSHQAVTISQMETQNSELALEGSTRASWCPAPVPRTASSGLSREALGGVAARTHHSPCLAPRRPEASAGKY